jgi:hypothetical protein
MATLMSVPSNLPGPAPVSSSLQSTLKRPERADRHALCVCGPPPFFLCGIDQRGTFHSERVRELINVDVSELQH